MRLVSGVLFCLLVLFAAVQYNDPDPVLWASIYGIGALWSGIAAFRPHLLARLALGIPLVLSLCASFVGLIRYWPETPGWWRASVWWDTETAKEGMGMMIVFAALLICVATAVVHRRKALSS